MRPSIFNERVSLCRQGSVFVEIGDRRGSFPGMLESRTFRVVFATADHGIGGGLTRDAGREASALPLHVPMLPSTATGRLD